MRKSQGLYSIHYGGVALDELAGNLEVKDLELTPDTAVYAGRVAAGNPPALLMRVIVPVLRVRGVKTPKALLHQEVEGRSVEIDHPVIELSFSASKKEQGGGDPSQELAQAVLSRLARVGVDSVRILHASLLIRKEGEKEPLLQIEDWSCGLEDLQIDSLAVRDSSRFLFARRLEMECRRIAWTTRNGMYRLQVENIRFASPADELSVTRFRVIPLLSPEAFAASFRIAKDRYDFTLDDIRLLHVDRRGLLRGQIRADSLTVGHSAFLIYKDASRPHSTADKTGHYPQEKLLKLSLTLNIRRVLFTNALIEYREKNPRSDSTGTLRFTRVTAAFSHVTNDRDAIARNDRCESRIKALFLDRAPLELRWSAKLSATGGAFSLEGRLGAMDATDINALSVPLGLARIDKGRLDSLRFSLSGNDTTSEGRLALGYHNVRITFLKKGDEKLKQKWLPTLLSDVLLHHSNPAIRSQARAVKLQSRRERRDSFFSFIWKSLYKGIKRTISIK
jgi:hypothetical protein